MGCVPPTAQASRRASALPAFAQQRPRASRCLLPRQGPPKPPPAPPTARLSRRVLARTAARGIGPPIIPPGQCRVDDQRTTLLTPLGLPPAVYLAASAAARFAQHTTAVVQSGGGPARHVSAHRHRLSKGVLPVPRRFTLPRVVCCSRQPDASLPNRGRRPWETAAGGRACRHI